MINLLQDIFLVLYGPMIPIAQKLSVKVKNLLITGCFLALMFEFYLVRIFANGVTHYRYYTLIGCILMYAIGVFSIDKTLRRLEYYKMTAWSWMILIVAMLASDYMVYKRYFGISIVFLFFFTSVLFIWANNGNRTMLWGNLLRSCRYGFLVFAVCSFLFRPRQEDTRYAGMLINPNMLGLILILIFIVYLMYLDYMIAIRRPLKRCIFIFIEMAIGFFFLFMTQCRTAFLSIAVVTILWFTIRYVQYRRKHKQYILFRYLIVASVVVIVAFPLLYKGLQTIPNTINHPVIYEKDRYYAYENETTFSIVAKAEDDILTRFFSAGNNGSMNDLSNGRIAIYKAYVKKINLWGHNRDTLTVNGNAIGHSHNNYIQFGYTYGIMAMIAFVIVTGVGILSSYRYFRRQDTHSIYAMFPLCVIVACSVAGITEAFYVPFYCFTMLVYYMCICELIFKSPKGTKGEK